MYGVFPFEITMTRISEEDHDFWMLFNKETKSLKKDAKVPYCAQRSEAFSAWETSMNHFPFGNSSHQELRHEPRQASHLLSSQKHDPVKNFGIEVYPGRQRRKIIPIARLDLHGYTRAQADQLMITFLQKYYADDRNTVKKPNLKSSKHLNQNKPVWVQIITGKSGIFFSYVPEFLKKQSHLVSSYVYARDNDGGKGALYVRLRRRSFL